MPIEWWEHTSYYFRDQISDMIIAIAFEHVSLEIVRKGKGKQVQRILGTMALLVYVFMAGNN